MKRTMTVVAAIDVVLIIPAAFFLASVLVGVGDPPQYELAHRAQRVVRWFEQHGPWSAWLLLITCPFAAFGLGASALIRKESIDVVRAHLATVIIAITTAAAAAILGVVALHMAAN